MYRIALTLLLLLSSWFTFGQQNDKSLVKTESLFETYLTLIDQHCSCQTELLNNIDYYKKISDDDYVFNGEDLKKINIKFSKILKLLTQSTEFSIPNRVPEESFYNGGNNTSEIQLNQLAYVHLRIKTFETYRLQQLLFGNSIKLANLINEDNKLYRSNKNSLKRISKNIISESFRKSILNSWVIANNSNNPILDHTEITALMIKIKDSNYYEDYLEDANKIHNSKKAFKLLRRHERAFNKKLGVNNLLNDFVFSISKRLGNFSGLFVFRKGKLYNNKAFIESTSKKLEPLDVILEKTPFRLTDSFIPGFWSHTAVYIGNEAQLKELGIWDNQFILEHHGKIKDGGFIIEALRSNVKLSSLKQFSNIDDFAHIRLNKEPSLTRKREMIIRAFAQIGKRYDFRYDVESSETLVCSELDYIIFDQITFETLTNLGIHTVSIDKIAEEALENKSFNLIDLYLNGEKVEASIQQEIYEQLLILKNKEIRKLKKEHLTPIE